MKSAALGLAVALLGHGAHAGDSVRFSPDAFRAHVAFLADDLLEGRDTGSRGHAIAARYVASQMAGAGLSPGGVNDDWYQMVPLREARLVDGSGAVTIGGRRFANMDGVLVGPSTVEQRQNAAGEVVFAGHCLIEPSLNIDDFRGLDVRGKLVACLPGFPKGLPSETAAYLTDQRPRFVGARGGIGMLSLWTAAQEKQYPFARAAASIGRPRMQRLNADGSVFEFAPGVRVGATLAGAAAEALFAGAPRTLAQVEREGEIRSVAGFALKPRVRVERESSWRAIESPNVIGVVRGTDSRLAAEYVVLGAHLDHLGVGVPVKGDAIYNGALDNAAGSATLIEVAKATAAARPKRSVMFIAATAEEKGLLGAEYFAGNPTVPAKSIVGMIDLDMPILTYAFTDVTAYGADHSDLAEHVRRGAAAMGVALAPDPIPEETIFVRSDHYAFVQQGIPAVMLATGFGNGGGTATRAFLETHYHEPSDDLSLPIKWEQGARFAELNFRILQDLANAPRAPRWYAGDFFGERFAPGAPRARKP